AQAASKLVRPVHDVGGVGGGERVLILGAARDRADLNVLHRLEINGHAGNVGDLALQPVDDLVDMRAALVARLERDRQLAGIGCGVDGTYAQHGYEAGDI